MKNKIRILLSVCLAGILLTACGASGQEGNAEAADGTMAEGSDSLTEDGESEAGDGISGENVSDEGTGVVMDGKTVPDKDKEQSGQDKTDGNGQASENGTENADDRPSEEDTASGKNNTPGEENASFSAGNNTNGNGLEKAVKRAERGMKLSILGDSISTYDKWIPEENNVFYVDGVLLEDVSQTWWKILIDGLGLELCSNGSSSMSACFGDSRSQDPMVGSSDLRISQLAGENGEIPDLIIVYMGTNDVVKGAPVGNNDGLQPVAEGDVENFSDAYTLMLDKLDKRYPAAQIYCCTMLPLGDWGTEQPFVPFVNARGLTSEPYAGQIRVIAGNRGIPVIDLYHCGISVDNMTQTTFDGVHPTPEGMQCIANTVWQQITE